MGLRSGEAVVKERMERGIANGFCGCARELTLRKTCDGSPDGFAEGSGDSEEGRVR